MLVPLVEPRTISLSSGSEAEVGVVRAAWPGRRAQILKSRVGFPGRRRDQPDEQVLDGERVRGRETDVRPNRPVLGDLREYRVRGARRALPSRMRAAGGAFGDAIQKGRIVRANRDGAEENCGKALNSPGLVPSIITFFVHRIATISVVLR